MSNQNVSQFQFDLPEVAALLLKRQGVKEGRWTLGVAFVGTAAVAGPTPELARPAMIVAVEKLVLARAEPNTPEPLVIDASKLDG